MGPSIKQRTASSAHERPQQYRQTHGAGTTIAPENEMIAHFTPVPAPLHHESDVWWWSEMHGFLGVGLLGKLGYRCFVKTGEFRFERRSKWTRS